VETYKTERDHPICVKYPDRIEHTPVQVALNLPDCGIHRSLPAAILGRRRHVCRGQPTLPERITAPLTPEQIRALGGDDPWGSDEEFEAFLADLADTRSRD
jgi:hypothetical protein